LPASCRSAILVSSIPFFAVSRAILWSSPVRIPRVRILIPPSKWIAVLISPNLSPLHHPFFLLIEFLFLSNIRFFWVAVFCAFFLCCLSFLTLVGVLPCQTFLFNWRAYPALERALTLERQAQIFFDSPSGGPLPLHTSFLCGLLLAGPPCAFLRKITGDDRCLSLLTIGRLVLLSPPSPACLAPN